LPQLDINELGKYIPCQGAFYKRRAKNAANCASASSPIDFVTVAGLVRVHKT